MHGSPYTEYTTSIYGHYGILYKLPMKLLGGDLIDFIFLNTVIGALCFLAAFLALHFIVKNNLLRILGAIALTFPVLSMRSGIYWQLWPHRILFMCLMLFWIAFCVRFKKATASFVFWDMCFRFLESCGIQKQDFSVRFPGQLSGFFTASAEKKTPGFQF